MHHQVQNGMLGDHASPGLHRNVATFSNAHVLYLDKIRRKHIGGTHSGFQERRLMPSR